MFEDFLIVIAAFSPSILLEIGNAILSSFRDLKSNSVSRSGPLPRDCVNCPFRPSKYQRTFSCIRWTCLPFLYITYILQFMQMLAQTC